MTHLRKVELVGKPRSVQSNRSGAHVSVLHHAPRVRPHAKHALRVPTPHPSCAQFDLVGLSVMLRYLSAKGLSPFAGLTPTTEGGPPRRTP